MSFKLGQIYQSRSVVGVTTEVVRLTADGRSAIVELKREGKVLRTEPVMFRGFDAAWELISSS